jgi:DNA modification methylase
MTFDPQCAEPGELDLLSGLSLHVRNLPPATLAAFGRKARTHSKDQIRQIVDSIRTFGFAVPVLVDEQERVIAGNARVEAAIQLGLSTVPVVTLSHLSTAQKQAFILAENKLATLAGWDKSVLRLEFAELGDLELDFDLEVTGFSDPEIDALTFGGAEHESGDKVVTSPGVPTSRLGDLWLLGRHRLLCGDATDPASLETLMGGEQARVVFQDPPYNVKIGGHVTGSGRHGEFVMASGEMSDEEFTRFLERTFARTRDGLTPGGLAYVCMDFRHMRHVLDAAEKTGLQLLNLIVWDKGQGGMGAMYRSRHELIFLLSRGDGNHLNRVQLGKHGRDRHNVWCYPGVNGFGAERARAREMHPTVKPLALVRDALLDCSKQGDLVLDLFSGSGTTIIAAEDSGRRGAAMDLDPLYVDTTILRWQDFSGEEARLAASGRTYREVRAERSAASDPTGPHLQTRDLPPVRVRTRRAA